VAGGFKLNDTEIFIAAIRKAVERNGLIKAEIRGRQPSVVKFVSLGSLSNLAIDFIFQNW
jgi:hypothetical protein